NVILMVRVRTPVQVQIATIVAEINRNALNDLGVQYGGGDAASGLTTPGLFNFGYVTNGNIALQLLTARLHLLESRNAAKTLANPPTRRAGGPHPHARGGWPGPRPPGRPARRPPGPLRGVRHPPGIQADCATRRADQAGSCHRGEQPRFLQRRDHRWLLRPN